MTSPVIHVTPTQSEPSAFVLESWSDYSKDKTGEISLLMRHEFSESHQPASVIFFGCISWKGSCHCTIRIIQ